LLGVVQRTSGYVCAPQQPLARAGTEKKARVRVRPAWRQAIGYAPRVARPVGRALLSAFPRLVAVVCRTHSFSSPQQCHGSGKTEFCKQIGDAGFQVLDEAFVDMPEFSLHPQTLVMENIWVAKWIERCLQKQKEVRERTGTDQTIFFADRSPYSAVFYARGPEGKLLEPLIQAQLKQLHELAGITIITVYVKVRDKMRVFVNLF
jgi:hypothetical protein